MPGSAYRSTSQPDSASDARQRATLERLAFVLDNAIPLPGGFRIGLDGIIGLIPGLGDVAGSALSSFIILQASRLGAPRSVLLRMAGNVALETLVGVIPVAGDLFDFAWKANLRNVQLLERHLIEPSRTRRHSVLLVSLVIATLLALSVAAVLVIAAVIKWAWISLTG